jgi:hypothetical protein
MATAQQIANPPANLSPETEIKTGADIVVETPAAHGVKQVSGVPLARTVRTGALPQGPVATTIVLQMLAGCCVPRRRSRRYSDSACQPMVTQSRWCCSQIVDW